MSEQSIQRNKCERAEQLGISNDANHLARIDRQPRIASEANVEQAPLGE
jgi:hypothetical protein